MTTLATSDISLCCVCGNSRCEQAYDHTKITNRQLYELLQRRRIEQPHIRQMQANVDKYYTEMTRNVLEILSQDRRQVKQSLKRMEFLFLECNKVNLDLVGEVASGDFSSLPSRKVIPLVELLQQPTSKSLLIEKQSIVEKIILNQTSQETIAAKLEHIKQILLHPLLAHESDRLLQLKKKVSIRQPVENPESETYEDYSFTLKNIVCLQNAKEIQLNNKGITDADLFGPMQFMKQFKNLTKLELRFNKITQVSCRLIAVNLGNLQRLDIRGNKLKDSSVIIMARALKNLSELFVCDNDLSDQSMAEIVTSLKVLTLIWLQNNRVTYKGAEMIIGHEKVKAIGLLGNIISHEEASTLRNRYTFGYLSI